MSDIPYPHEAEVWRTADASGGGSLTDLDSWGNPKLDPEDTAALLDDSGEVVVLPCWVQELGLRQRAEAQSLAEAGDEGASHTVFCDPFDFHPTDYLVTRAGGGQIGGERHRVIHITNPDGGEDHLELLTELVLRGTSA